RRPRALLQREAGTRRNRAHNPGRKRDMNKTEALRAELIAAEDNELITNGWQHTHDVPGARAMWQRDMADGRTIVTDRATALALNKAAKVYGGASNLGPLSVRARMLAKRWQAEA